MTYERRSDPSQHFVETPLGIVSTSRNWYHTTREAINDFIPGLLKKKSLEEIIIEAEAWVKSPDSTSLLIYLGLSLLLPGWLCAVLALAWFAFWYLNKSAFVKPALSKVFKVLNSDGTMMISSLIVLSYLGIEDQYLSVTLGIALYILFKVGLLRLLAQRWWDGAGDGLPLNDRVLKMLLLRYGKKFDLQVPQVEKMEQEIVELMNKRNSDS
jgi:hypothetical protein